MRRDILCWELVGIVFIVVPASVLHFVFEWSGGATAIAPIALAVLGILFVLPRSYPLQVQLFRDSITGGYGIVG